MLQTLRARVAAAIALILVAGVTIVIVDNGDDHGPDQPRRTITVTLGGPGKDKVALAPAARDVLAEQKADVAAGHDAAAEAGLKDTAPPAAADTNAAEKIVPDGQPEIPESVTDAAPSVPGCATKLVRNYSSRRGAPVLLGMIHWTGSRPTLGSPASGLAIVRWFDTPAASASSNEITDQDGRCWLTVPETQKAWTQAGFNPWSVSVEIINQGVQPLFQNARARAAVVRLMRGWHQRWKIPYRRGRVSGCRVLRSGFLAHRDLGQCGGGHPDVGTFDLDQLIREASRAAAPIPQLARLKCRKLKWWRAHGRPHGLPELNARKRRNWLTRRGLVCPQRGPTRAR